jgi:hypothetical protein
VRRGFRLALVGATLAAALVLTLRVRTDAYYLAVRRAERTGLGWNRDALPIDAAAYASRAGLTGRMLNHLNYGGYLMWALRQPVFIDGRLEVMGERFYETYRTILGTPEAFADAVRRYDVEWVIVPYAVAQRFLGRISADPGWRLAYVDADAVIFVRADRIPASGVDPSAARALAARAETVDVATRHAARHRRHATCGCSAALDRRRVAAAAFPGLRVRPRRVPLPARRARTRGRAVRRRDPRHRRRVLRALQQPRLGPAPARPDCRCARLLRRRARGRAGRSTDAAPVRRDSR